MSAVRQRLTTKPPPRSELQATAWGTSGLLKLVLLFGLTLAVYWPALHGTFIWDDEVTVTDNPLVRSLAGLRDIWFSSKPQDYWPLTYTSFWLEWRLWGMDATGYRLVNVVLHALACVLLWRVLLRLRISGAWLAALAFALHPVCVGSVAWISERKNTLSLVFYFLSVLWFLRFDSPSARRPAKYYWLSLLAFLLALLSKTSVVTLPFVLLLCHWWTHRRNGASASAPRSSSPTITASPTLDARLVLRLVPFFLLSLVLGLVTVWFQTHRAIGADTTPSGSLLERLVAGTWGLWFYLYKAVVPVGLSVLYPRWEINTSAWFAYLPAVAWMALLWLCWKFRRGAGGAFLFGLGFFTLSLLPVLGFFDMSYLVLSRVADHWQYLALVGIVTLGVGGLAYWTGRWKAVPFLQPVISAGLVAALGYLSWERAALYGNPEMLWRDALRKAPRSWGAYNELGAVLTRQEKPGHTPLFQEAIRLNPNDAEAHNNLGQDLFEEGKVDAAIASYRTALKLKPYFFQAHYNLAVALARQDKLAEAAEEYGQVLQLRPDFAAAHNNLGNLLDRLNRRAEAKREYMEALRLEPNLAEAHNNLGNIFREEGKAEEALQHYRKAAEIKPAYPNARLRLGQAALAKGNLNEAAFHLAMALEGGPGFAEAHNLLGYVLSAQGKKAEAASHLTEALRIDPTYAEAHYNLGEILLKEGKTAEAEEHFLAALKRVPDLAEAHFQLGVICYGRKQPREAVAHWRQALKAKPDWSELLNNLAWVFATSSDATVRDGPEAVRLATRAVELTRKKDIGAMETLAAALAESGHYSEAVQTCSNAWSMASAAKDTALAAQLEQRLRTYRSGQPFRE